MAQGKLTSTNYQGEWPSFLRDAAQKTVLENENTWQPVVISMANPRAPRQLERIIQHQPITRIVDNYDEQLAELIVSRQPQLYQASYEVKRESLKGYMAKHYNNQLAWRLGSWVYYPWSGYLVHILEKELHFEAHTIRNRDLMTSREQEKFAQFRVGCAGMSVGSNVALSLMLQGGSNQLKIADGGVLSASNLNRVVAGVHDIGEVKALVVARNLFEANPYLQIECHAAINEQNIAQFFDKPWPLAAVVDEVDDLEVKILLRTEARKRGVPVLMATDLGDDVMLDIERFDLNKNLPLFHGLAGPIETVLGKQLSRREWLKYSTTIINTKNVPLRMQQSLLKIGTEIVTQPQLGGTALMAGSVVSYALRKLALKQPIKSGRTIISLDKAISKNESFLRYRLVHMKHTRAVKRSLDTL